MNKTLIFEKMKWKYFISFPSISEDSVYDKNPDDPETSYGLTAE